MDVANNLFVGGLPLDAFLNVQAMWHPDASGRTHWTPDKVSHKPRTSPKSCCTPSSGNMGLSSQLKVKT